MELVSRLIHIISLVLYRMIGMRLPHTFWPGGIVFSRIRKLLLTGMGCKVGIDCEIEPHVDVGFRPNLVIGNNCQLNQNTTLKSVIMGDDVMIAPGVVFLDRSHNFSRTDISMREQGESSRRVTNIDNDVWIGQNAIIFPGLKIGEGVIVGAGSVVTSDLAAWTVAAGSPARVIRSRVKEK
jgi:maltose O-acetyltransferase